MKGMLKVIGCGAGLALCLGVVGCSSQYGTGEQGFPSANAKANNIEEAKPMPEKDEDLAKKERMEKMVTTRTPTPLEGAIVHYEEFPSELIAEYPGVFGGAACMSSHWPAGDGVVVQWLKHHLPPAGSHRIYFDLGTETLDADYGPYQRQMDEVMRQHGYTAGEDWVTLRFEGADHSPRAWRERLHIPLKFLLGQP